MWFSRLNGKRYACGRLGLNLSGLAKRLLSSALICIASLTAVSACKARNQSSKIYADQDLPTKPKIETSDDLIRLAPIFIHEQDPIAKLIEALPEQMKSNYTLMYNTNNPLKESSFKNPRAILSTYDGRLIAAFNGNRDHVDYELLEIIEAGPDGLNFFEVRYSSDRIGSGNIVRKANQECNECHQGRLIWNSYNQWPGAYGGNADVLQHKSEFQEYIANTKNHPRYKQLMRDATSTTSPYSERQAEGDLSVRPNTRLSIAFQENNFQRIGAELQGTPRYKTLKYYLYWLYACQNERNKLTTPNDLKVLEHYFSEYKLTDKDHDFIPVWSKEYYGIEFIMKFLGISQSSLYLVEPKSLDLEEFRSGLQNPLPRQRVINIVIKDLIAEFPTIIDDLQAMRLDDLKPDGYPETATYRSGGLDFAIYYKVKAKSTCDTIKAKAFATLKQR